MDSDWILIYRMRQGAGDAWEQFVRKYYPDILKYCRFHCAGRESAEDLTQETFVRFFSGFNGYRHQGKAKNYLYTIAANLCRDHYGREKALPLPEDMAAEDPAPEERLSLEQAVGHLPDDLREVIILRYYQDLRLSQIAGILNIGLSLVKYRLKRAKELLRKELEHESE